MVIKASREGFWFLWDFLNKCISEEGKVYHDGWENHDKIQATFWGLDEKQKKEKNFWGLES